MDICTEKHMKNQAPFSMKCITRYNGLPFNISALCDGKLEQNVVKLTADCQVKPPFSNASLTPWGRHPGAFTYIEYSPVLGRRLSPGYIISERTPLPPVQPSE